MRRHWYAWLAGLSLALATPGVWAQHEATPHDAADAHAAPADVHHAATPAGEHGEAAHGAHGEEMPPLLQFDPGAAVWSIMVFVALLIVLRLTAWKPILNVLNDREAFIEGCLKDAKREREEAEKLLAEHRAQLAKAQEEATAVIEKGRQDAEAVRQRILDDARNETADMTARAKRDIQLAADSALKELYDRTAELSIGVAGRIIQKELSADDHSRLIADSVAAMKREGPARLN